MHSVFELQFFSTKENTDGTLTLKFDYDIMDSNLIPRKEFDDDNFFNLLGDILVDVIDRGGNKIGNTDDRENGSQ